MYLITYRSTGKHIVQYQYYMRLNCMCNTDTFINTISASRFLILFSPFLSSLKLTHNVDMKVNISVINRLSFIVLLFTFHSWGTFRSGRVFLPLVAAWSYRSIATLRDLQWTYSHYHSTLRLCKLEIVVVLNPKKRDFHKRNACFHDVAWCYKLTRF